MSTSVYIGAKEYFPGIGRIPFEGRDSDNPLAYKVYDADKRVGGKTMAEHLRFAVAYWHSFCATGHDPFGPGTRVYPWDAGNTPLARAEAKADAAFEFITKLGVPYYCFHDIDLAPDADDIAEYEANLQHMVGIAGERQKATGVKLLWGTANLFSHPRYMNGASTNPDFAVVARAAVQVKAALEATVALGGENYVFWGGREGYACLYNTDMKREKDNMARFLTLARDHGRSIGFTGNFLIEPKPMEPMNHQYDFDSATVVGFLREHGLDKGIPSPTTCRSPPMPACSAASTPTAATHRTAGTPISSRPTCTTPSGRCWSCCARVAWPRAGSTSMPRCGASRPRRKICSRPTSAAWMRSHAAWRWRMP